MEEVLNEGLEEEEVLNEGLIGEVWTMTQLRSCLESDQVRGLGLETMFGTLLGLLAGDDEDFGDGEENLERGRSGVGGRCDRFQCSIPWGTIEYNALHIAVIGAASGRIPGEHLNIMRCTLL